MLSHRFYFESQNLCSAISLLVAKLMIDIWLDIVNESCVILKKKTQSMLYADILGGICCRDQTSPRLFIPFELKGTFIATAVCSSSCLSVSVWVCLSVGVSVCLSVCLSMLILVT